MIDKNQLLALTHTGENNDNYLNAVVPPVFLNSLHVYDTFEQYANIEKKEDFYVYGRMGNPTTEILEKKLADLEHGKKALVFSSGMAAATSAIVGVCKSGDHIICMRDVYGPVKHFMDGMATTRLNFDVTYVTGTDLNEIEKAIRPNTKLMILESPATFVFTVVDLPAIANICKKHNIVSYIDNTYCTPLFQNPLDFGIDIVMHTLSKYIGGHSDIIGGALISNDITLMDFIKSGVREWFGGILGPMESWLAIRGMRSLYARLQQHQETSMKIASFLENHPKVESVFYTGLNSHPQADIIKKQMRGHTGLMSVLLKATPEQAVQFINNLHLFGKGCSWGGFESLALCPLYYSSEGDLARMQCNNRGLIRIHCGLEGAENLLQDLQQALDSL